MVITGSVIVRAIVLVLVFLGMLMFVSRKVTGGEVLPATAASELTTESEVEVEVEVEVDVEAGNCSMTKGESLDDGDPVQGTSSIVDSLPYPSFVE